MSNGLRQGQLKFVSGKPTALLARPRRPVYPARALMRLLDRYLLREFATPFCYCFFGFYVFWVSFDLLAQLDMFQRNKLSAGDVLKYYLIKMPDQFSVVIPVALLLGCSTPSPITPAIMN